MTIPIPFQMIDDGNYCTHTCHEVYYKRTSPIISLLSQTWEHFQQEERRTMTSATYELKADEASAPIEPLNLSQEEIRSDTRQQSYRYDGVLWSFGLLFLSILLSLIFGIGKFTSDNTPL